MRPRKYLTLVDRFLPKALPGRASHQKGADSESTATETVAVALTREAEVTNNQV